MSTASSDPYNQVVTAADFSICLSSAAGALSQSECFPDTLELSLCMAGQAKHARATCSLAELRGGYRNVYLLADLEQLGALS